jgi:hypothetical protein
MEGAPKNVEIAQLPPLWVGEVAGTSAAFEITDKPATTQAAGP